VSYGHETLTVVKYSAGIGLTGLVFPPMFAVGLGGIVVGPPIVHWSHGNVGTGFLSMAMIAGGIGGGAALGASGCHRDPDASEGELGYGMCKVTLGGLGAILGGTAAILVDAHWLAWEEVEPPGNKDLRSVAQEQPSAFRMVPLVRVSGNRTEISIYGEF